VQGVGFQVPPQWPAREAVIGRYPDLTLKKTRVMRDKLSAQVAEGKSPAEEKPKLRRASTQIQGY
jgi:hypothetical protein